jgi:amphi-Trp domain-containing protein
VLGVEAFWRREGVRKRLSWRHAGWCTPISSAVAQRAALTEIGEAVSDVKVQQKQSLSRQEAARFIAALAGGLGEDGKVTVQLGSSTLELSVADQVDWELEVEVNGDEIELELELKWSTSGRATVDTGKVLEDDDAEEGESADVPSVDVGSADVEPGGVEPGGVEPGGVEPEAVSGEDGSRKPESSGEDLAEDENETGDPDKDAAASDGAEPVQAVATERTPAPRRGRRGTAAGADKPAFNGVDTAAVRAWAAANGLTVSPRGRIKDEVLQAYRDAGN